MSQPIAHGHFENVRQDSLPRQPRSDATVEKTSFPTASIFIRSVLQCVAVGVSQCVAMCCSVLQCFAVCCTDTCVPTASIFVRSVLQCVLVSVLQCVAVSVLQCAAVCCHFEDLQHDSEPRQPWSQATVEKNLFPDHINICQVCFGVLQCVAVCCSGTFFLTLSTFTTSVCVIWDMSQCQRVN